MSRLHTIFTFSLLLSAGPAFAQPDSRDSTGLFRALSEHTSPFTELTDAAFRNTAIRTRAFETSFSEVAAGYEMRREEQALEQQKGDGADFGRFSARSYRHLSDKSTVWGDAGYCRGVKHNVVWNSSSDYDLIFPYVTADSIGGDLTSEEYTFSGGYGHRSDRYAWGLQGNARALHEYRNVDPRPRNIALDIGAQAGISYRLGAYEAGISAAVRIYKQTGDVDFYNPKGVKGEYQLSGLGSHYARFMGVDAGSRYQGTGYTLAAVLLPARHSRGFYLTAAYERMKIEKILLGYNHLPLQKVVPQTFRAEAAWIQSTADAFRWGIALKVRYDYRAGKESIVAEKLSNRYETLGEQKLFEYSRLHGRVEATLGIGPARSAWYLLPWAEYERRTTDYLYPAQNVEFTHAGAGADVRYVRQMRRTALRMELGGGYVACLDNSLSLPIADMEASLVSMVQYDEARRSKDRFSGRAGVRADYALQKGLLLFLSADYGADLYEDDAVSHYARIMCGITF